MVTRMPVFFGAWAAASVLLPVMALFVSSPLRPHAFLLVPLGTLSAVSFLSHLLLFAKLLQFALPHFTLFIQASPFNFDSLQSFPVR
jgi:hypothetical protein